MPGFNIAGTGGEAISTIESRRNHRWKFTLLSGNVRNRCAVYLAKAARPHITVEEAVMHHDQEEVYFAGKHKWSEITLVFYDVVQQGGGDVDSSREIWDWINECIAIQAATVSFPIEHKRPSELDMTLGDGVSSEMWRLYNSWVKDCNWNDLDYSSNEIKTVDVVLRYDRANRQIRPAN